MRNYIPPKPEVIRELGITEDEYYECCFLALDKWGQRAEDEPSVAFGDIPVQINGKTYRLENISTMRHEPKCPPEPYYSAYWALLRKALVQARNLSSPSTNASMERVHDLLEALHNLPDFIWDYGGWHVHENLVTELKRYDDKWADEHFALMRELDRYLKDV